MPRQVDLTPQNLKVTNNPNNQISASPDQIANYLAAIPELLAKALQTAVLDILKEIDSLTGLNLVGFGQDLEELFSGDLLGGLLGMITGNGDLIQSVIDTFLSFLSGGSTTTGGTSDLSSLLDNIPLIGPLIEALGGSGTGTSGLASAITALPESIIDTIVNAVTGGSDTGNPLSAITSALEGLVSGTTFQNLLDGIANALGVSGTGKTISDIEAALQDIPQGNVSGLLEALENVGGDLAQSLIDAIGNALGLSGTGLSVSDIETVLENIPGGNIVGEIDNAFVNAQNLFNQILPGNLGLLPVSQIGSISPELLTNPSFDSANSLSGQSIWTWDGTVGHTTVGSATTTGDGTTKELLSNSIYVTEGQQFAISTWVQWSGLTTSGSSPNPIHLDIAHYLRGVEQETTQIAGVSAPGSSSSWTQLSGTFTAPSGIDSVRVRIVVDNTATGGQVWYDDSSCSKTGLMSGSWMAGISSTVESDLQSIADGIVNGISGGTTTDNPLSLIQTALGAIPFTNVLGQFGATNIGDSLTMIVDGIYNGLTNSSGSGTGLALLSNITNQIQAIANNALDISQSNSALLAARAISKPGFHAVDPTLDGVFNLTSLTGSSATTIPVTASTSAIGFINIPDDAQKGSIAWLGQTVGTLTTAIVNLYSVDKSNGLMTWNWSSSNVATQLGTGMGWIYVPLPSLLSTPQGSVWGIELQTTGSGTHNIVGIPNHWLPANSTVYPQQLAAERTGSPVGAAPATMTPTYSGNVPFFALSSGMQGTTGTFAPATTEYSSNGTDTYYPAPWANYVDLIGVGGGGAGQGEQGYNLGQGGLAGSWNAATLTIGNSGSQLPPGHPITVSVGKGGPQQITYFANGNPGTATTFTWTDASGTPHTLTCAGGAGGSGAGFSYNGASPGNETYHGTQYFGGSSASSGSTGDAPGGGGGGAPPYLFGGAGADGAGWFVSRQS